MAENMTPYVPQRRDRKRHNDCSQPGAGRRAERKNGKGCKGVLDADRCHAGKPPARQRRRAACRRAVGE